jgi:hypothetical protein
VTQHATVKSIHSGFLPPPIQKTGRVCVMTLCGAHTQVGVRYEIQKFQMQHSHCSFLRLSVDSFNRFSVCNPLNSEVPELILPFLELSPSGNEKFFKKNTLCLKILLKVSGK